MFMTYAKELILSVSLESTHFLHLVSILLLFFKAPAFIQKIIIKIALPKTKHRKNRD